MTIEIQDDKRDPDTIWTHLIFKDKDGGVVLKLTAFDCPDVIRLGDKT